MRRGTAGDGAAKRAAELAQLGDSERRLRLRAGRCHECLHRLRSQLVEHRRVAVIRARVLWVAVQPAQSRHRHGAERVELGAAGRAAAPAAGGGLRVAEDRAVDDDELAAADRLGQLGQRRQLEDPGTRRDVVGRRARPLGPGVEHEPGVVPIPRQPAGVDLGDREQPELDRGDDAEIAQTAAQRPQQLGIVIVVDPTVGAVGEHELDGGHMVRLQAALARLPAEPTAERIADDADGRRGAMQGRKAVLGGRVDNGLPANAGLGAGRSAGLRRS